MAAAPSEQMTDEEILSQTSYVVHKLFLHELASHTDLEHSSLREWTRLPTPSRVSYINSQSIRMHRGNFVLN